MRKKHYMYCCRMKLSNIHLAEFKLSILYYIHQHVNSRCCQMSDHSECGAIWGGCFGTLVLLVALLPLNLKSALGCSSGPSTCSQHISFETLIILTYLPHKAVAEVSKDKEPIGRECAEFNWFESQLMSDSNELRVK